MIDFTELDRLKTEFNALRPLNPGELLRLREEFIIDNTYNSNAIEGSSLTLRETALILKEGITIGEKPLRDHLDAIGHRDAFDYILSILEKPLTERIIKNIHSLVLMNDAQNRGVYRSVPVTVSGSKHVPPQPYLIEKQMETLLADYNSPQDAHIISAISEFHLRFEAIHPFIDGNGRTGRLIANFELIKAGYLPVNIKYTDRKKYYDCFDEPDSPDALTELILLYEKEQYEHLLRAIRPFPKK
jgi:Fic family protein